MSARRHESDRRRSRPVQKRSKIKSMKRNKSAAFLAIFIIIMLLLSGLWVIFSSLNSDDDGSTIAEGNPIAVFDTTAGQFKVELYQDKLPNTCANFIKLVNDGFYDGMIFHRVKDNFMIQAGRYYPDGSQSQSPYGPIDLEVHPDVKHVDGAISMGQAPGDPNSATSEFFICDGAQRGLDDDYLQENYGQRGYAAFGVTIEGLDVVKDIASTSHDNSLEPQPGGGKPLTDIVINSITIEE